VTFTQSPSNVAAGTLGHRDGRVRDAFNNVVTTDSSNITISIASGTGTLLGTLTVAAANGIATFSDLAIHTSGAFTLKAHDGLLTDGTTASFTISAAAASQLVETAGPP